MRLKRLLAAETSHAARPMRGSSAIMLMSTRTLRDFQPYMSQKPRKELSSVAGLLSIFGIFFSSSTRSYADIMWRGKDCPIRPALQPLADKSTPQECACPWSTIGRHWKSRIRTKVLARHDGVSGQPLSRVFTLRFPLVSPCGSHSSKGLARLELLRIQSISVDMWQLLFTA